jgi:AraC family transcriptional regulator, regulatory protein of adaptative response / DNA-3-methyladenine glycosylase II
VAAHGEAIDDREGGLTHLFPDPQRLANLDPGTLAIPRSRRTTLTSLVAALASGEIELGPGSAWEEIRGRLLALPGFGPWTVEFIAMRGLGNPDAFPAGDLGVVGAARALGLPATPAALAAGSAAWRPWRAYAVQHLWATGRHAINEFLCDEGCASEHPRDTPPVGCKNRRLRQSTCRASAQGRHGTREGYSCSCAHSSSERS